MPRPKNSDAMACSIPRSVTEATIPKPTEAPEQTFRRLANQRMKGLIKSFELCGRLSRYAGTPEQYELFIARAQQEFDFMVGQLRHTKSDTPEDLF